MENKRPEPTKESQDYPLRILQIKLGEWEGVYEHWNQQMYGVHGPFAEGAQFMDEALWRINQLKEAINILTHHP